MSVLLALRLADERRNAPIWETSFELARKLRTLSEDHPEQYEAAALAFCDKTGQDYEHFWLAFNDCWGKVRLAEGDDVLAWAVVKAEAEPYPLPLALSPAHGMVASIAYHLAGHTSPKPFFLPLVRLKNMLGVNHEMVISRAIQLLKRDGIIECVNESYCFRGKDRRAKEFRFTGPQPD